MTEPTVIYRFRISQSQIERYADLAEDHNPLHLDPEFARARGFSGTIAHGLLTVGLISAALAEHWGPSWSAGGRIDIRFVAPVTADVDVDLQVTEVDPDDPARRSFAVVARTGDRDVVRGVASVAA